MNNKKEYVAPKLTVVTFKTERGYAASTQGAGLLKIFTLSVIPDYNFQAQETWTEQDNLGGSWDW